MSSFAFLWPAIACVITGAALYVTRGVLDQTVTPAGVVRFAMLPPWQALLGFVGLAALVLVGIDHLNTPRGTTTNRRPRLGGLVLPLIALAVLILPFLPVVPDRWPVFQALAGPLVAVVWLGVAGLQLWTLWQAGLAVPRWLERWTLWRVTAAIWIATATLARGPKSLAVGFENDKYEKGKGDRNLFVEAVALLESCGPDAVAPWARIAWPPAGHPVHLVDAVIADAGDDRELAWGELVIDGKPTGVRADLARRPGRMVFPLLARELAAGEHTLAVRVRDAAGNGFATPPAAMSVLAEAPAELGPYARAVHLLNRFAYGPEPDELAAVLTMGEQAWLADRLSRTLVDAGEEAALEQAVAQFANGRGPNEVQSRAVLHALASPNPVRVRAVQWIENHFSTWIRKTGAELEWPEHVEFLRLGPRTFADLVLASARSPSMLRYLDAPQSVARRLNENYAREIMELHTLGVHGGYTQADVTALASLLTGWGFAEEGDGHSGGPVGRRTFRFDPQLNDGSPRLALGLAFPKAAPVERYDRARMAIELLCAHPSHARFVCRKLAEHYVAVPAPDDLVEDLARVYVTRYGDLEEVLLAISRHPAFWAAPVRMTSPFDFAMRLSRTSGAQQPGAVMEFLQRSGMGGFDRATPDGYPEEDRGWANSNALLQRWRLARRSEGALAGFVPGPWRGGAEPPDDRWRQAVLDAIAVRLTGNLLGENSNRAALDLLAATRGDRREVVRAAAAFVAQLPEANVR